MMLWMIHPFTDNDIVVTLSEKLPLEIHLNQCFAKEYNKCKSHESQLVQMIIKMTSSNQWVQTLKKVDIFYNKWFMHRHIIVDDAIILYENLLVFVKSTNI